MTNQSDDSTDWREKLTADQFHVCRQRGTEPAFTGKYTDCVTEGVYHCVCCGLPLFSSTNKFHSGCGWPSFWAPLNDDCLKLQDDNSHDMRRIEVSCVNCNAHLGHVFPDGPQPTGLRYCINSVALNLIEKP